MGKHLQTSPVTVRVAAVHQYDKNAVTRPANTGARDSRRQLAKERDRGQVITSLRQNGVSARFLFISLIISSFSALGFGRFARLYVLQKPQGQLQMLHTHLQTQRFQTVNCLDFSECPQSESCTKGTSSTHNCCIKSHEAKHDSQADIINVEDSQEDNDDNDKFHYPSGEQLSVDVKNVDADFLSDRQRLTRAMIDTIWESDLMLLSYHCHMLPSSGVSCTGVLQEGVIMFHTWPVQGVLALNLFAMESDLLIPVVAIIERNFAATKSSAINTYRESNKSSAEQKPIVVWSRRYRGSRDQWDRDSESVPPHSERKDLGKEVSNMDSDLKQLIASVETPFQQIDIYDFIEPRYRNLLSHRLSLENSTDTYESRNPELFRRNRVVFLDGVSQSTRSGDESYHEGLVHPGMFAHPNPKRAAIVGGGEGATLREILRHGTIEHVKMIEIDELMVKTSAEFLPDWNDCSDIAGSTPSCFDDPRTDVRMEDALAWFIDRYASTHKDSETGKFSPEMEDEKFDVIIMDALDPQDDVVFAKFLYSNDDFTDALYNALTDDGVLIMQLGEAPQYISMPDEVSTSHMRASLEQDLVRFKFKSMHQYEESACEFDFAWSYLVAFKDFGTRKNWYESAAEVDLKIKSRIRPTVSGKPRLKTFDGSTMSKYQVPHTAFEEIYCRSPSIAKTTIQCENLRGYEAHRPNANADMFHIRPKNQMHSGNELGVHAKSYIPKGTMVMQEARGHSISFLPTTWAQMKHILDTVNGADITNEMKSVVDFARSFGFESTLRGKLSYEVPSDLLTLVNHANESKGHVHQAFNPVIARRMSQLIRGTNILNRDVEAGEELLARYLTKLDISRKINAEMVHEL